MSVGNPRLTQDTERLCRLGPSLACVSSSFFLLAAPPPGSDCQRSRIGGLASLSAGADHSLRVEEKETFPGGFEVREFFRRKYKRERSAGIWGFGWRHGRRSKRKVFAQLRTVCSPEDLPRHLRRASAPPFAARALGELFVFCLLSANSCRDSKRMDSAASCNAVSPQPRELLALPAPPPRDGGRFARFGLTLSWLLLRLPLAAVLLPFKVCFFLLREMKLRQWTFGCLSVATFFALGAIFWRL